MSPVPRFVTSASDGHGRSAAVGSLAVAATALVSAASAGVPFAVALAGGAGGVLLAALALTAEP